MFRKSARRILHQQNRLILQDVDLDRGMTIGVGFRNSKKKKKIMKLNLVFTFYGFAFCQPHSHGFNNTADVISI